MLFALFNQMGTHGAEMAAVRPRIKNLQYYTITNAVELAPLPTLINQYLNSECPEPATRRAYSSALELFSAFLSTEAGKPVIQLSFSDVTRSALLKFRHARLGLESPASAALRLRVVKAFCNWMARRYHVDSPADLVPNVNIPAEEFRGLNDEQYKAFVAVAKAERDPVRKFLPLLMLGTGLRNNELRTLTIDNISADKRWLLRVLGKGNRFRNIPLSDEVSQDLQVYLWHTEPVTLRPTLPLFPSRSGGLLDNKTIWRLIHDLATAAGIPKDIAHPHALRHTFAYRTLNHLENSGLKTGRALIILRDILGHSSINTTMRYLGNDAEDVAELMREFR